MVYTLRLSRHIGGRKQKISSELLLFVRQQFLVFTHVMRRPRWCTKQRQNVVQVLHNNRIKFSKDFFRYCSVHQHGRRDVTWKPRIAALLSVSLEIGCKLPICKSHIKTLVWKPRQIYLICPFLFLPWIKELRKRERDASQKVALFSYGHV